MNVGAIANGLPPGSMPLLAGLIGLLVGSFLNVVVLRLPVMLERAWRLEAEATLAPETVAVDEPPFNLLRPGSRCPHCSQPILWWQNVPVLSWLWLRGRCASCAAPISVRYPLVELGTALLSAAVIAERGASAWSCALLVLLWSLIALALIDYDTTLLPDVITLPLLWVGLLLQTLLQPTFIDQSVWGAALGYGSLWSVYQLFKLATGKEGMGFGDFKLLAALGAWFGAWTLLPLILLSTITGAVIGIGLQLGGITQRGKPIPFGPFLATAGIVTLLLGPQRLLSWVLPGSA